MTASVAAGAVEACADTGRPLSPPAPSGALRRPSSAGSPRRARRRYRCVLPAVRSRPPGPTRDPLERHAVTSRSADPAPGGAPETGSAAPAPDAAGPAPALALSWRPTLSAPPPRPPGLDPVRRGPLLAALAAAAALAAYVGAVHGTLPAVLLLLGTGLGVALFHSRFGFTSAWRQFIAVGNGAGLRAHALLLGTTATLFALIIGTGTGLFGYAPQPSAGPIGIALFLG